MKVEATVCYPVYLTIDVPGNTPIDEIREKIIKQADILYDSSSIEPVIHNSNIPELID